MSDIKFTYTLATDGACATNHMKASVRVCSLRNSLTIQ